MVAARDVWVMALSVGGSDEWCPSRLHLGTSALQHFIDDVDGTR